jgi:hypothetical protein
MLGGVGAALSLPLREATLDDSGEALADGSELPVRFVMFFFGNGNIPSRWNPSAQGTSWELTEQLAPLANVKDYCSVLSGFQNRCAQQITHHEGMTVFNGYSFVQQSGLFSKAGGPTIDQQVADVIGDQTTVPSVQLGVSRRLSVMDSGTTLHHLSHRSTELPLPSQFEPAQVYNALFGAFTPKDDPSGPLRIHVLDAVRETTNDLRKRVGKADAERLDAHLEGVASLEKKIKALPPVCTKPDAPTQTNDDVGGVEPIGAVSDVMSDLLAYAFGCDITRVASFMLSGGAAETVYGELGQNSAHHENTHNPGSRMEDINEVVIFNMQRFAYLLERLMGTPDGAEKNVLDNSVVMMSSDCSEGWSHSVFDQPIVVAGGGGGCLVHPGIHYRSPSGENPSDILLSCLRCFDPAAASVGGGAPMSSTPLAAILA